MSTAVIERERRIERPCYYGMGGSICYNLTRLVRRSIMKTWQLQNAKSHFSELVQKAQTGEAQVVTKHGREVAVVLDYKRYLELTSSKLSVLDSFKDAPDLSVLKLERDKTSVPVINLE